MTKATGTRTIDVANWGTVTLPEEGTDFLIVGTEVTAGPNHVAAGYRGVVVPRHAPTPYRRGEAAVQFVGDQSGPRMCLISELIVTPPSHT